MPVIDLLEITITFNAKCNECGKDVSPGKALWSKSSQQRLLGICLAVKKSVIK
jgi:hypothetical protein